ncbi:MAG: hypothetical protein U9R42_05105 [Bacteroidota bacterium]|nr:hypothetical protein [Bacteroidota bacterium]
MKVIKSIFLLLCLIFLGNNVFSQSKPITNNDTVEIYKNQYVSFNVLRNDIIDTGRAFKFYPRKIVNKEHWEAYYDTMRKDGDSSIYYKPTPYFYGNVNISYWIWYSDSGVAYRDTGYLHVIVKNVEDKSFDTISANNISAGINSNGDLFWDYCKKHFKVPKNENINSLFVATLWIGGLDDSNKLHIGANTYSYLYPDADGDFKAGPIATDYSNNYKLKYDRVWKVTKSLIQNHVNNFKISGYQIPDVISNWPASNDGTYGEANSLAKFIDYDSNGVYNPEKGDYPYLIGDELLFFMYNDEHSHIVTDTLPLGIEIHGYAYQFKNENDVALNNTLFIRYEIINRSNNDYHELYLGNWVDFELGYPFDDYVGCNPAKNMYYVYNGDNDDSSGYGENPPVMTVNFLNKKLDYFIYYNNDWSLQGNPQTGRHYYNYLHGLFKNGQHMKYGGNGFHDIWKYENTNHIFPDHPEDTSGWSEVTCGNTPADRRGLGSTGPYNLKSNDTLIFDVAYTFVRKAGKSNIDNIDVAFVMVDDIRDIYDTINFNPTPLKQSTNIEGSISNFDIKIFPNPSTGLIYFQANEPYLYQVCDQVGKLIVSGCAKRFIDISELPDGIYNLTFISLDRSNSYKTKIIKVQ